MKVQPLTQPQQNPERDVIGVACYRSRRGAEIAARLESAAGNDAEMLAEADMIRVAADVSNVWHGANMHNADGELYDGAGVLWQSGSRLCPSYMKASRARARARVREAMLRVHPIGSERWRLITLTMPTMSGCNLEKTLEVFAGAWGRLRKREWWRGVVRAGIKGEEFTLGDTKRLKREGREWDAGRDGYHVHAHVLVVSEWVEWKRLGEEWTACLEQAAKRAGVPLSIATTHGRAVVDVRLVGSRNRARGVVTESEAVEEVCKYITKAESWLKLPDDQLCEVAKALRGRRMLDLLGELNMRKGSERGHQRKTQEERASDAAARARSEFLERERVRQAQWLADDPREGNPLDTPELRDWREIPSYLDTQKTFDGSELVERDRENRILPKRLRRKPLRIIGKEMIERGEREKWLELLREYVRGVQDYRRGMLGWRYPLARFSTLDGRRWDGMRVSGSSAQMYAETS